MMRWKTRSRRGTRSLACLAKEGSKKKKENRTDGRRGGGGGSDTAYKCFERRSSAVRADCTTSKQVYSASAADKE